MIALVLLALDPSVWENPAKLAGWGVIKVYQLTLSELQPDVCNFNPSCSRFGERAIRNYGPWGILMASDRLLRCNPSSWSFVSEEYEILGGKLHEDGADYYIFQTPKYPPEVLYPW